MIQVVTVPERPLPVFAAEPLSSSSPPQPATASTPVTAPAASHLIRFISLLLVAHPPDGMIEASPEFTAGDADVRFSTRRPPIRSAAGTLSAQCRPQLGHQPVAVAAVQRPHVLDHVTS